MVKIKCSICLPLLLVSCFFITSACATTQQPLKIYFIDVEGGQATLLVTPEGQSLLIDAGYAGQGKSDPRPGNPEKARDPQRILSAAKDAKISRIDYLLVTHFHQDHFSGVIELSRLMPINTIIDHGTGPQEERAKPRLLELINSYKIARERSNYVTPTVGEQLTLGKTTLTFVSSAGNVIESPVEGGGQKNPSCNRDAPEPSDPFENPRSTGILIEFGDFRFLNLGDLVGEPLSDLACPVNRIGPVDVFLIPHHGGADAADPAILDAFKPRVALLNNGAKKGGHPDTFELLHSIDQLEDVWQLHWSEKKYAKNFDPDNIANLNTSTHHPLKLEAYPDGSFLILNERTGRSMSY